MIGAPVPLGLVVLDIDPYHGGSIEAVEAVTGSLPATVTTWSGRGDGGRHLFFRVNPDVRLVSTRLPEGVDLRAGGKHYTIIAPSLHPMTGQPYRWEGQHFAVLPYRALRALMFQPPPPRAWRGKGESGEGLVRTVAESTPGNRNASLFWACMAAAGDGILADIRRDLIEAACSAGLSELEAHQTVRSAERRQGVSA